MTPHSMRVWWTRTKINERKMAF